MNLRHCAGHASILDTESLEENTGRVKLVTCESLRLSRLHMVRGLFALLHLEPFPQTSELLRKFRLPIRFVTLSPLVQGKRTYLNVQH